MPTVLNNQDTVVSSGAFNRRVQFQKQTSTPDSMGGKSTPTWNTVLSTWAHIESYKGNEAFVAQQVLPTNYFRVLIRYRPSFNISDDMQMVYGTRFFNIRSVSVLAEAMTTIELLVQEIQAPGSLHS